MGLVICQACGRQREFKSVPQRAFKCFGCGAHDPLIIRNVTSRMRLNGIRDGDSEGIGAEAAAHATYARLKGYQETKGYKAAWLTMKFKAIFHRPPNGEAVEEAAPMTAELKRWIEGQNKRWARERRKSEKPQPKASERHSELMTADDWDTKL